MSEPENNVGENWTVLNLAQIDPAQRHYDDPSSILVPDIRAGDWVRVDDTKNMRVMVEDCGICSAHTLEELSTQRFKVHSVVASRKDPTRIRYLVYLTDPEVRILWVYADYLKRITLVPRYNIRWVCSACTPIYKQDWPHRDSRPKWSTTELTHLEESNYPKCPSCDKNHGVAQWSSYTDYEEKPYVQA
jgi:hypothetical protein